MNCPYCENKLPQDASSCHNCGAPTPADQIVLYYDDGDFSLDYKGVRRQVKVTLLPIPLTPEEEAKQREEEEVAAAAEKAEAEAKEKAKVEADAKADKQSKTCLNGCAIIVVIIIAILWGCGKDQENKREEKLKKADPPRERTYPTYKK